VKFDGQDRFETRHRRKDGSIFDVEVSVKKQELEGGTFVAFLRDITERKLAEQQLVESERRIQVKLNNLLAPEGDWGSLELIDIINVNALQDLMDVYFLNSGFPVAIVDIQGRVMVKTGWQNICTMFHRVNPDTRQLCYECDTALAEDVAYGEYKTYQCKNGLMDVVTPLVINGRHLGNLFTGQFFLEDSPPDREFFRAQAHRYGFDESAYLAEMDRVPLWNRKSIDQAMQVYIRLVQIVTNLGASNMTLARSLEQRKLAEEALRHAHAELEQRVVERTQELKSANLALEKAARAKDEFLASMSHELRTPLTGILGLSEALQMVTYGELSDKQRSAVKNIESSGRHLLALINDILDLSKIEAGKVVLQIEACSLGEICQSSLQLTKGMANQKKQKVSYSMQPASIFLMGDGRRLKQMVVNLLGNAIKFTQDGGRLGIDVFGDEQKHELMISVWDEGIGIEAQDLPRLFQPFIQLDTSLSRQHSGTGLGLSLVQRLAELHRGRVEVQSAPGKGSRFTIYMPWVSVGEQRVGGEKPAHARVQRVEQTSESGPLVLIADDNQLVLDLMSDFLLSRNFRVNASSSGKQFLEQLELVEADVILMDIQMPGIDGIEVIRRLRAHPSARTAVLPVIAVTALAMAGDRERCLEAGANAYLSKPVELQELLDTIEQLCLRKS